MRNYAFILMTIFIGLLLSVLPMPVWAVWLRPAWLLMILIYWTIHRPDQVNVGLAWFSGLMLDFLTGTALGEHALAFVLVIYIVSGLHHRLSHFPLIQQSLCVLLFSLAYQIVIYTTQYALGEPPSSPWFWSASLTTMLLWPWLFVLLDNTRLRFRVL